jgi:hypothetical protein
MNFNLILSQPAFVIHISELSPERTPFFTNNIKNAGYTDMRIFKGVNLSNKNELNDTLKLFNNQILINKSKGFGKGHIGCMLSHLKLYKHIIDNNISICTIFEDDVHFHPNWNILSHNYFLNTPKDFDVLFIGNQINNSINTAKIHNKPCYTTHAYIITLNGAKNLLNSLLNWNNNNKYIHNNIQIIGLYIIDVMIYNIQSNNKTKFIWYCWNGLSHTCKYNRPLPLTGVKLRNCGLVFQSTNFKSIVDK